jgi:hypothetical protein
VERVVTVNPHRGGEEKDGEKLAHESG